MTLQIALPVQLCAKYPYRMCEKKWWLVSEFCFATAVFHGTRNEVSDGYRFVTHTFSKDGADGSMLEDNLFELKNGCICCTVKDDLVITLENLLQRRNKFDYIIIETTGLANPVGTTRRFKPICGEKTKYSTNDKVHKFILQSTSTRSGTWGI